ncbi:type-F conjugative transfer system pilin assembly protein TrbC [uncultured Parasutterella sp.]|jgi:conjugal transfer pilus assembly protein TrbC|uniref:type-F conjugative transfer system pilin assembly protein TrbC n=1 Tax=uncultured Parasutterella sp. TaxID=1263098 RepID=UPI0025CE99E9|nr:type-F conjugative transfer system pilin assembly protein TrbC [uncultured Parasutterella sp.]
MNKSYFFKLLLSALLASPLISFAASEPWTIEDVLEASSELSQQMRDPEAAVQKPLPQAFVLVSFSMPQASLERLARDAKDAGVPLVFRGVPQTKEPTDPKLPLLNPQSLTAFQPLIDSGADVQLNPELFSEFSIRRVPALIIKEESSVSTDGCIQSAKAVIVQGDVTLGYALDRLTDRKDSIGEAARTLRAKLGNRP